MRTSENSIKAGSAPRGADLIERMRFFYELFPYPDRPLFLRPNPHGSRDAHAGFSRLVSTEGCDSARLDDLQLRDVRHAFAQSKRIALVGCGTDEPLLFRTLHPHNPIVAIDLSLKSLMRAERKIRWHNLKPVTLIHGDAEHALLSDAKFDHIQCFGVLHHQPDARPLLKAMAQSLHEDGTLRLMIYSSSGRRLERGIQRRFATFWNSVEELETSGWFKSFVQRLRLRSTAVQMLLWRLMLPLVSSATKALRFRYIGLSSARLADAFLHPSDHALQLRDVLRWAQDAGLELVFHKAKCYESGLLCSHATPKIPIQTLVTEEERGNISTNIVLVFKKVASPQWNHKSS